VQVPTYMPYILYFLESAKLFRNISLFQTNNLSFIFLSLVSDKCIVKVFNIAKQMEWRQSWKKQLLGQWKWKRVDLAGQTTINDTHEFRS